MRVLKIRYIKQWAFFLLLFLSSGIIYALLGGMIITLLPKVSRHFPGNFSLPPLETP